MREVSLSFVSRATHLAGKGKGKGKWVLLGIWDLEFPFFSSVFSSEFVEIQ